MITLLTIVESIDGIHFYHHLYKWQNLAYIEYEQRLHIYYI